MVTSEIDTEYNKGRHDRRIFILGGAMAIFSSTLAYRMHFLQVSESSKFRLLAEENRINVRLLPPTRGEIFDRNGILLAGNKQNFKVILIRDEIKDLDQVLLNLEKILKFSKSFKDQLKSEILKRSPLIPITVSDNLSWEQLSNVAVNSPILPGVSPEVGLSRFYPRSTDYSHIIGYVGAVGEKDIIKMDRDYREGKISEKDPLLEIPKFQVGKTGVENKLDRQLRGKAGNKRIEVNSVGRIMRELSRAESIKGADINLTIDTRLQHFVQERLSGLSASAVIMNVNSGDLLAIGSTPAFDPNKFIGGISHSDYNSILENPYNPLWNKSVQGSYPPGSTFKMIVSLAALEAGVISINDEINCKGFTEISGRKFYCWKSGGHGKVNLHNSLKQSCDHYYYELSQRIGISKIAAMARRLGVGEKFDLPLPLVESGIMPSREWRRKEKGQEWKIGDTLNTAIGQGDVLTSPLQLAVITARLATNSIVKPRLIKSFSGLSLPIESFKSLNIDPAAMREVRRGMYSVVNDKKGTAYSSRVEQDDKEFAGKTGTSQVTEISKSERKRGVSKNEDKPWKYRDHALFVGYAPFTNPKYSVSVVVEHGGSGSTSAAPIARDIMLAAQYGSLPPLSAYPEAQRSRIGSTLTKMQLVDPEKTLRSEYE
jgi:penicillin-binding protein 2